MCLSPVFEVYFVNSYLRVFFRPPGKKKDFHWTMMLVIFTTETFPFQLILIMKQKLYLITEILFMFFFLFVLNNL